MSLLTNIVAALFGMLAAVFEASVFYAITDLWMGFTITWPLVLAVGFCAQIVWQLDMANRLEDV